MKSVVGIYVEYPQMTAQNTPAQAFGSGVIVSEDGYLITNSHVIQNAMNIVVQTQQGQKASATVIGSAPEFDLSVLKIDPLPNQSFQPIRFGHSHLVHAGDTVTAIGNSFGFDQTLTKGVVSHVDRDVSLSQKVKSYLQVDAAINPGNSGGALVNERGELVGVVSGIFGPRFNIGIAFAIPADIATPVIKQLVTKGHASNGWIGMITQPLTPELKDALNVQNHSGILVSEVLAESPAQRANLSARDIILSINDIKINSPQHFASLVTAYGSHSLLNINYLRNNKVYETRLKTDNPNTYRGSSPLGPWGLNLTEFKHARLDGITNTGVQVHQVANQSNADISGLMPGDIIKSIDNRKITQLSDIKSLPFSSHKKTHLLEIERHQHTIFIPIR